MKNHEKLIIAAGGKVISNRFIESAGIMITQTSKTTQDFLELSEKMNLDDERPEYEVHGELNSRITYMSFHSEKKSSKEFNHKMVNEFKHLSIYNDHHISILLAGISVETSQEIVAHNEATVSRLTSSKTLAQSNPLFVLNKSDINNQMKYINEIIDIRKKYIIDDKESDNMMFPCSKAVSIIATMSLKDWHKTLIGRLSKNGVEQELQDIMIKVCNLLNEKYPLVIKTADEYYSMNNGAKYES